MMQPGANGENVSAEAVIPRRSIGWSFGRLLRPANIITAYADILAGYGVASVANPSVVPLLLLSTTGLYGGGIVLNDVFDVKIDSIERPERPIPSSSISLRTAAIVGTLLLAGGVLFGWRSSPMSGMIAFATAMCALLYDTIGKRHPVLGPINMGLCRSLNFLLGASAGGEILSNRWLLAVVPLCYIAGITSLSRGEVAGGTRKASVVSGIYFVAALALFTAVAALEGWYAFYCLPFIAVLLFRVGKPFWYASKTRSPDAIRRTVKAGILSLILLDASLAAIFSGPWYAASVLLLYLPAAGLAKLFAVT